MLNLECVKTEFSKFLFDPIIFSDLLEKWNKPREVKLPAVPIYDINFERERHGKKPTTTSSIQGSTPSAYNLHESCLAEQAAASTFLTDLCNWSSNHEKELLMNTITNPTNPIDSFYAPNPFQSYVNSFRSNIEKLESIDSQKRASALQEFLAVSKEESDIIQEGTLLQSSNSDWFFLRQFRITGSKVGRVCNYYRLGRASADKIAEDIIFPSSYQSAAMKFGSDFESTIIDRYTQESNPNNVTTKRLGLVVDPSYPFLAASPDSGIEINGSISGILECKTAVKFSGKTVEECLTDSSYPFVSNIINSHPSIQLRPNHVWYHQIQLQLFVCRRFAQFCDLAIMHPESNSFFCQRFHLDNAWVQKYVHRFQDFFSQFMIPKILSKYVK